MRSSLRRRPRGERTLLEGEGDEMKNAPLTGVLAAIAAGMMLGMILLLVVKP